MTLMELLAVMTIMVILVSIVLVAVLTASRLGPKKGAAGLLMQLTQGLEQYKAAYGMYVPQDNLQPPTPGTGTPPAPPWPYVTLDVPPVSPPPTPPLNLPYPSLLANYPWSALQLQASTFALWQGIEYDGQYVTVAAASKAAGGKFTDPRTGATTTWYFYKDYWGTPIRYVCLAPYNQYSLTCAGEDMIFGTPDDIVQP
jgi:type II secretory pathway pseudopilin PulG